jgi:hypothetical protein
MVESECGAVAVGCTYLFPPLSSGAGEDRSAVSDVIGSVYDQCIELMAGRAAERMLLSDSEPVPPVDDLRQARELAMLICTSEEAIETFIAHCDVAARDLLLPYSVSNLKRLNATIRLVSHKFARKFNAVSVLPGPPEIKGLCDFRILTVRLPHEKHRILVAHCFTSTAIKLPLQKQHPCCASCRRAIASLALLHLRQPNSELSFTRAS